MNLLPGKARLIPARTQFKRKSSSLRVLIEFSPMSLSVTSQTYLVDMSDNDFEQELDGINNEPSDDEEFPSRENDGDDNADIMELQTVMQVPGPDASIADLRKVMSIQFHLPSFRTLINPFHSLSPQHRWHMAICVHA